MCHLLDFLDGWDKRWVKSDWKKDENMAGEWNFTAGKWHGDPNDKGTVLSLHIVTLLVITKI